MNEKTRAALFRVFQRLEGINRDDAPVTPDESEFAKSLPDLIRSYQSIHDTLLANTRLARSPAWQAQDGAVIESRSPDYLDVLIVTGVLRHLEERLGADLDRLGFTAIGASSVRWLRAAESELTPAPEIPPTNTQSQATVH